jgi:hypothetical protein
MIFHASDTGEMAKKTPRAAAEKRAIRQIIVRKKTPYFNALGTVSSSERC